MGYSADKSALRVMSKQQLSTPQDGPAAFSPLLHTAVQHHHSPHCNVPHEWAQNQPNRNCCVCEEVERTTPGGGESQPSRSEHSVLHRPNSLHPQSNRSFTPSLLLEMPILPTAAQQLPPVTNLSSFLTHLFPGSTAEELNASFHPRAQVKTPTAAFPMIVSHYLSRLK